MKSEIISGEFPQFYHTIPNNLDLITTAPTREGIFKSLSQIGYDKFPEFILDILIKIEGHKPIDVTDGQGDEKQDILTINPKGERCLTQCKHTVDYSSHYNGVDLDLLVAACMRKNCKQAFFVTNSDLTPQGKKYVNDEEYNRGFKNSNDCPVIDYLNGFKIWEKIKNNQDIINKWFSGLGQVHGLRSFKFDLTIQEFPIDEKFENSSDAFDKIINTSTSKTWIEEITKGLYYKANISDKYIVYLKRWFQFTGNLDINIVIPENELNFFNKPLYALTIEVVMNPQTEKYSPAIIRDEIVKKICDEILSNNSNDKWWHLITSQINSFIYLHDINEPREINLASASTFVKTKFKTTINEFLYCSLSETEFKVNDSEDDSLWIHRNTGIQIVQMFEQQINPIEQYNHQLLQYSQLEKTKSFKFFAIEKIDSSMLMRVRRILNPDWIAFQYNKNTLIWSIDPIFNEKHINLVHEKIKRLGLTILSIKTEDVNSIIEQVKTDIIPSSWMYTSNRASISYPIMLNRRIFWISKSLKIDEQLDIEKVSDLLKFKFDFENEFGFDYMEGRTEKEIHSSEIKNLLFDFFTIRGKRMVDISITNNPISINVRFAENRIEYSNDLVIEYLSEFDKIFDLIKEITI